MVKYLIGAVLIIGSAYGLLEAWPLLVGPSLSVVSPAPNAVVPDGILLVEGRALRTTRLTLNGSPLLHDQSGEFASTLTFPRGGSILTFEATDRFGEGVTITRSIYVP